MSSRLASFRFISSRTVQYLVLTHAHTHTHTHTHAFSHSLRSLLTISYTQTQSYTQTHTLLLELAIASHTHREGKRKEGKLHSLRWRQRTNRTKIILSRFTASHWLAASPGGRRRARIGWIYILTYSTLQGDTVQEEGKSDEGRRLDLCPGERDRELGVDEKRISMVTRLSGGRMHTHQANKRSRTIGDGSIRVATYGTAHAVR